MLHVRRSHERGQFNHGWLQTAHTFSFGEYSHPEYDQFRALRVMNEDHVAPGQGFGMHGHYDMEIVTYVLEGALEHRDSLGNGEVLRPGELQRMSAGTGIRHSEFNPSVSEPVHLYQIWLFPDRQGLKPEYEQKPYPAQGRQGRWQLVASPDGAEGSLTIHQDARLSLAMLRADEMLSHPVPKNRHAWLQVLRGEVLVNGERLAAGDGVAASDERLLTVSAPHSSEVLLFDLA
jgi:redox-sensitive bicupin YhaK (pirin superfamily)